MASGIATLRNSSVSFLPMLDDQGASRLRSEHAHASRENIDQWFSHSRPCRCTVFIGICRLALPPRWRTFPRFVRRGGCRWYCSALAVHAAPLAIIAGIASSGALSSGSRGDTDEEPPGRYAGDPRRYANYGPLRGYPQSQDYSGDRYYGNQPGYYNEPPPREYYPQQQARNYPQRSYYDGQPPTGYGEGPAGYFPTPQNQYYSPRQYYGPPQGYYAPRSRYYAYPPGY